MNTIDLQDVLPSYLSYIFVPSNLYILELCLTFLALYFLVKQYFKFKKLLNQKYSLLEIKPSYNSLKSAFSTKQFFTVLHSIHKPNSLIDRILGIKKSISCELVSTKEEGIRYILRVPVEEMTLIKKSLLAYLPSIEVKEVKDYLPLNSNNYKVKEMRFTKSYIFGLQDQSVLEEFDPISYLTAQMTKLDKNEIISIQLINTPILPSTHGNIVEHLHNLKRFITNNRDISPHINNDLFSIVLNILMPPRVRRLTDLSKSKQLQYKLVEDKIDAPLFETSIRIFISSNEKERKTRIKGIVSAFDTLASSVQSLKIKPTLFTYFFFKHRLLSLQDNPILSVAELASIFHFPYIAATKAEDLLQNKSPKLPSPLSFKKADMNLDIIFAHNTYGETTTPIGLMLEERRRHMYVIGATGAGKTTLLLNMIHEDIVNGKGLAILDPHGDLAERLLGVIPQSRLQDVVYFNPYDVQYPIGLNVLELKQNLTNSELQREKDLITSSLISVFHKLYPARYSGPRMEHVLRNTVLTALETENPTLFTVYRLLTDIPFRKQTVDKLSDKILKDFWTKEFGKMGSFQQAELISPITNKLGRFLTTTMTRNILNQQKSKLNFEDIMNTKKILICDLSKGKIGEDTSSFIGSLIIAKIQLAALNRVHIPQEERIDFFLYIDEFQNFATMTFAQILSEARKYRLNTILAHQTISQIEDKELLKVILANVGTVISFRTSNPSDEDFILPLFIPQVQKNEISNLPSYNFYIKINALNPQDAFTGFTTNFTVNANEKVREEVINHSQNRYGNEQVQTDVMDKTTEQPVPIQKTKKTKKNVQITLPAQRTSI